MSVNAAAIANAARNRSGPRGKRPLWITILLVVGAGVVWLLQQQGVLPQSSANAPQSQQSNNKPVFSEPSAPASPAARSDKSSRQSSGKSTAAVVGDGGIAELFKKQQSDTWVEAEGVIKKILPDDDNDSDGSSKHQRWIVRVPSGIEILIAHAFDVSARVPVEEGDTIEFRGEYEYTEKGGTVHFTHAPKFKRRDPGGWIVHNGTKYE